MTIIDGWELEELLEKRPKLKEELYRLGEPLEVWKLNDAAITQAADIAGKKTLILMARVQKTSGNRREIFQLILSQPGTKGAAHSWLMNPAELPAESRPPKGKGFVVIDKAKLGRHENPLTAEEKMQILSLRARGMAINDIAAQVKRGNRRVMEVLKHEADSGNKGTGGSPEAGAGR